MLIGFLISVAAAASSSVVLVPAQVPSNRIVKNNIEYAFSPKLVGTFSADKVPRVFELRLYARRPKGLENIWSTPVQYAISDGRDGATDVPGVSQFAVENGEVRLMDTRGATYVLEAKTGRFIRPKEPIVYGAKDGFKLTDVAPGSIYEKLGLKKEDTIVALNGVVINSSERAKAIPDQLRDEKHVNIIYLRNGRAISRNFELKR